MTPEEARETIVTLAHELRSPWDDDCGQDRELRGVPHAWFARMGAELIEEAVMSLDGNVTELMPDLGLIGGYLRAFWQHETANVWAEQALVLRALTHAGGTVNHALAQREVLTAVVSAYAAIGRQLTSCGR